MNLDQVLQTFIAESRELLEEMENALLALEQGEIETDAKAETVNAIFRAAHTIKGSAGLFGLDHVVAFTHVVENVLDEVRADKIPTSSELTKLLLSCADHIRGLIEDIAVGQLELETGKKVAGEGLLEQLRDYLTAKQSTALLEPQSQESSTPRLERLEGAAEKDYWHISLRFSENVLRSGMDPLSFIRYLNKVGHIMGVITLSDQLPELAAMDPEACYLGFEIALQANVDKATIENVFEFVREDCNLRILPPSSKVSEYIGLIQALPGEADRVGEILVQCGALTPTELSEALLAQDKNESKPLIGNVLVEEGMVRPDVVETALAKQKQVREAKAKEASSIRIDADKLDHLINLVGELIIAAASTDLIARKTQLRELEEYTSVLTALVAEIRDSALQLRMVKIAATFNRFQRVVYDAARELEKDIGLVIEGEDTELDKTVVEKIADPLMHLVRNAMDHGIESKETRSSLGKPAKGTVKLNAYHDSGSIVITVSDDGGGLRRDKILAKAIERGLVEPGQHLTDAEICNLIFEPGFSTAEQVTNLSGRGVGMDVVKRNITGLRGSVHIQSKEGVGSTVFIRLPLTLAIIDGFLVGLGKSVFVLPLDTVEECIEFSAEPGHSYTNLRGQVLPFIRLREIFEIEAPPGSRENIVVVKYAGQKVGLVVDTLLGEFQTVIKPLGKVFNRIKAISGSTILGNGEIALIVDVPMLVQGVMENAAIATGGVKAISN